MTTPKPLPPLSRKQLEVLYETLRCVIDNGGNGAVTITVQNGHVRYIQQQINVDLRKFLEDTLITE